jgi:hypothetical protein
VAPDREDSTVDGDAELTRLLRERLTRHAAPAELRRAVMQALAPPPPRSAWWMPWFAPALSALATAMVMAFWMAQSQPISLAVDPLQSLARAVVTEHARAVSWGGDQLEVVRAALPRVMDESGVTLNWVFLGDEDLWLANAQPTYIEGHRGLSLAYHTAAGHAVTYMIVPGGSVTLPDRGRVLIDRWRPVVRREGGFSLIMWKQQGLLCTLVSDLVSDDDLARLKEYFVKIRSSTEPAPTS